MFEGALSAYEIDKKMEEERPELPAKDIEVVTVIEREETE